MLENELRAAELAEQPVGKGRSRGRRVLFSNTGRGRGRGGFGITSGGRSFEVDLLKDMGSVVQVASTLYTHFSLLLSVHLSAFGVSSLQCIS